MKTQHKLSLIMAAIFLSGHASAIQVIKDDKNDVQLTGRAYAGHVFGDSKDSALYGSRSFVRFGAKAANKFSENMTAIGHYETQYQMNNPDNEQDFASNVNGADNQGSGSAVGTNLRTRLIYGGINVTDVGTFTFGRQFGAIYPIVGSWTDVGYTDGYTNNALGIGTDRFASIRGSDILRYEGEFNKAKVSASYKFRTMRDTASLDQDNSAYGLAASYEILKDLSLGSGYVLGDRAQTTSSANTDDAKMFIVGTKYDDKKIYAALTYAKGTDFLANGVDHSAYESALAYTFNNGISVQTTWEKQRIEASDNKFDGYNSYTFGTKYAFNKNLSVAFDYRINALKKDAYTSSAVRAYGDYSKTGSTYNSPAVDAANDFQFAVNYVF